LLAVVGLDLSARAYPGSAPVRDAAHRKLLDRFRSRADPALKWRFEVPIPISGDQRAWDAVIEGPRGRIAVEAETKLRDIQALQRRVALKRRDDPSVTGVVLLVAATHANRRVVSDQIEALISDYPVSGRAILAALSHGNLLSESGVVLI
jgi:hypothetical protein